MAAAGAPDVDGGADIADEFAAVLERVRAAYAHASDRVKALPIENPKIFYDELVVIFGTLNTEYSTTGGDIIGLDSPELRQAFTEADKCR